MSRVHEVLRWANRRDVAREVTKRGYRVSGETLNRWVRDEAEFPAVVERIVFELFTITGHKETPPPWAEALMTRDEVVQMVGEVQRAVTAEIEENRRVTRQAILGEDSGDQALVEMVKNDLRPLFQSLAGQFREEVQQLLDARFDGTEKVS